MILTALLMMSTAADASAYYLLDTGTRGMSRAGAYVAGVRDLSAQYYNPAGLIRLKRPQAYVNFSLVNQAVDFTRIDYDDSGAVVQEYDQVSNLDGPFPIPALGFSSRFGLPNTVFAVGMYPPFAPTLAFDPEGGQRYTLIDSLLIQINTGPSVAHRFTDWLTVGLGGSWVFVSAEQALSLSTCDATENEDCAENPQTYDVDVVLEMADPVKFSFNAGLLVEPTDWLAIGASMMGPVGVSGTGNIVADFGEEHYLVENGILTDSTYSDDEVTVLLDLPWIYRLGVAVYPNEKLEAGAGRRLPAVVHDRGDPGHRRQPRPDPLRAVADPRRRRERRRRRRHRPPRRVQRFLVCPASAASTSSPRAPGSGAASPTRAAPSPPAPSPYLRSTAPRSSTASAAPTTSRAASPSTSASRRPSSSPATSPTPRSARSSSPCSPSTPPSSTTSRLKRGPSSETVASPPAPSSPAPDSPSSSARTTAEAGTPTPDVWRWGALRACRSEPAALSSQP